MPDRNQRERFEKSQSLGEIITCPARIYSGSVPGRALFLAAALGTLYKVCPNHRARLLPLPDIWSLAKPLVPVADQIGKRIMRGPIPDSADGQNSDGQWGMVNHGDLSARIYPCRLACNLQQKLGLFGVKNRGVAR